MLTNKNIFKTIKELKKYSGPFKSINSNPTSASKVRLYVDGGPKGMIAYVPRITERTDLHQLRQNLINRIRYSFNNCPEGRNWIVTEWEKHYKKKFDLDKLTFDQAQAIAINKVGYYVTQFVPFGAQDHTISHAKEPVILRITEAAFDKEMLPYWDELLRSMTPNEDFYSKSWRPLSEQGSFWDDDEDETIMDHTGRGTTDWHLVWFQMRGAIKQAIDNRDSEGLLESLNFIEWIEQMSENATDALIMLHNIGALVLESTDIRTPSTHAIVQKSHKWNKPVKLLVPTMIKREYLYTFLYDYLLKLQNKVKALLEKFDYLSEWDLTTRLQIRTLTDVDLSVMDGSQLMRIHKSIFGLRQIVSTKIQELMRTEDGRAFNYTYKDWDGNIKYEDNGPKNTYDPETMDDDEQFDNSQTDYNDRNRGYEPPEEDGDSMNFNVISQNPLLLLDTMINDYFEESLDSIKIYENLSRSMVLNPIVIESDLQIMTIMRKFYQFVWKTYDNTFAMTGTPTV